MANSDNLEKHIFKKGESGNPSGRPKGSRNTSTVLKELLEKQLPANVAFDVDIAAQFCQGKKRITSADALAARLLYQAIVTGDLSAIKEVLDRTEGKPLQKQQVSGNDGQPLVTTFVIQTNSQLKEDE